MRLEGDRAFVRPRALNGSVVVPPSKSETHRALVLAARSAEPVRVHGPLMAQDTQSTREAIEGFGASVEEEQGSWLVRSKRLGPPTRVIDCGNSGTTLRLMTAQAALMPATIELTGDESLRRRPNEPLLTALESLGVRIAADAGRAPITLKGPLIGGEVRLPGGLSSQFASALMLALPFAEQESVVTVESPVHSRPYLDLTLAMAQDAGLSMVLSESSQGDLRVLIPGQQQINSAQITVGADWSTAALLMVAALLSRGSVALKGLDQSSAQGDRRIADIIRIFGGKIEDLAADQLLVTAGDLVSPGRIDVGQTPDLFPPLCALAAVAKGQTLIQGSAGLRHKECDRIDAMAQGLRAAGIVCHERADGLLIEGGQPNPAELNAQGDHRIHMALCALALAADGPSTIDSAWSTIISYPNFHADLASL